MTITSAIPQLHPDVPGAPRTETLAYGTPAQRFVPLPPADDQDQILDLANNATRLDADLHALCSSPQHVRAVCVQVGRLETEQGQLATELTSAHAARAVAELRVAELETQVLPLAQRCVVIQGIADSYSKLVDSERQRARDEADRALTEQERAVALHIMLVQRDAELAMALRANLEVQRAIGEIRALVALDRSVARAKRPSQGGSFDMSEMDDDAPTVVMELPLRGPGRVNR